MPKALQLEMNWLDRAIGYVAPIWGARRMQSRYTMAAAQHMASGLVTGVRRLSGSGEGTLGNWNPRREQRLAKNRSFDTITLVYISIICAPYAHSLLPCILAGAPAHPSIQRQANRRQLFFHLSTLLALKALPSQKACRLKPGM